MDKSEIVKWSPILNDINFNIFLFLSPDEIQGCDRESYTLAYSRQVWKLCNYENEDYYILFNYEYLRKNEFCKAKNKNINFKMLYAYRQAIVPKWI